MSDKNVFPFSRSRMYRSHKGKPVPFDETNLRDN